METLQIAIPPALKEFVEIRVAEQGYSDVSEYLSALIRADQTQSARQVIEAEVLRGVQSGDSIPMTQEDWDDIRGEVRKRHELRNHP